MQTMLLRTLFLLLGLTLVSTLHAQHPWDRTLSNTTDDLVQTLRLQVADSVCVSEFQGAEVPDSIQKGIEDWFVHHLLIDQPGVEVLRDCKDGPILISGDLASAESSVKVSLDAANSTNGTDWAAVFFLPEVDQLPNVEDSLDVFNLSFFQVPSMPAKGSVLRMSGHVVEGTILSVDGIDVVIETEKRNGKKRTQSIHKSEIFSISFDDGEWILYSPDELIGDDLTVDEMRIYIAGEQDARTGFKTGPTFIVGVLTGGATAFFAGGGLILTILPPVGYTILQLIPVIKIQGNSISNPDYKYNDLYAMGYERVARPKKLLAGLKGSFLGSVLGVTAYFLTR
ncbi:MAG: hypothetical protein MK081_05545 [Flavobacteriales bacterium]|nr:hypothetical protein [Flavobacteriales bacterium]